jgi:hypothetical protein
MMQSTFDKIGDTEKATLKAIRRLEAEKEEKEKRDAQKKLHWGQKTGERMLWT